MSVRHSSHHSTLDVDVSSSHVLQISARAYKDMDHFMMKMDVFKSTKSQLVRRHLLLHFVKRLVFEADIMQAQIG